MLKSQSKGKALRTACYVDCIGTEPRALNSVGNINLNYRWILDYTDIDLTAKAKKGETVFHVAAAQGSLKALEVCLL